MGRIGIMIIAFLLLLIILKNKRILEKNFGFFVYLAMALLIGIIIFCGYKEIKERRAHGQGSLLFEQKTEKKKVSDENEGRVVITIQGNVVKVGRKEYDSLAEAKTAISISANDGKSFTLIDDLAYAGTYMEIKNELVKLGVNNDRLEEKEASNEKK